MSASMRHPVLLAVEPVRSVPRPTCSPASRCRSATRARAPLAFLRSTSSASVCRSSSASVSSSQGIRQVRAVDLVRKWSSRRAEPHKIGPCPGAPGHLDQPTDAPIRSESAGSSSCRRTNCRSCVGSDRLDRDLGDWLLGPQTLLVPIDLDALPTQQGLQVSAAEADVHLRARQRVGAADRTDTRVTHAAKVTAGFWEIAEVRAPFSSIKLRGWPSDYLTRAQ